MSDLCFRSSSVCPRRPRFLFPSLEWRHCLTAMLPWSVSWLTVTAVDPGGLSSSSSSVVSYQGHDELSYLYLHMLHVLYDFSFPAVLDDSAKLQVWRFHLLTFHQHNPLQESWVDMLKHTIKRNNLKRIKQFVQSGNQVFWCLDFTLNLNICRRVCCLVDLPGWYQILVPERCSCSCTQRFWLQGFPGDAGPTSPEPFTAAPLCNR